VAIKKLETLENPSTVVKRERNNLLKIKKKLAF